MNGHATTALPAVRPQIGKGMPRLPKLSPYWLAIAPAALLLLLFYVVPLLEVVRISLTDPSVGVGNYTLLFSSASVQRALLTTLRIAALTTAITIVLGYAAAYSMRCASGKTQRWMLFCVLFPFWISVLVRTFAWLTLLRGNGLLNNALIGSGLLQEPIPLVRNETGVVIGMVHAMLPYAILVLYSNMSGIDVRLMAAARGLGADRGQAFQRVFLPLTFPGVIAALALVFIFSLGFYVTPAILGGGKTMMIAEYIALQINETLRWGLGTMLATTLIIAIGFVFLLISRVVDLRGVLQSR